MKCTKSGVPVYAVAVVSIITCITFLVSTTSAAEVFNWFVDLTTAGLITTYSFMIIIFLFWHRARTHQGLLNSDLPYVAPYQPFWAYFALGLGIVALVFMGFDSFAPFSVKGFVTNYFCIPYSAALYFGCKFWQGTKIVDLRTADLITGKAEVDEECRVWEEGGIEENYRARLAEMPFWKRCWEKMW